MSKSDRMTRLQRYELALLLIACTPGGDERSMKAAAIALEDKFNIEFIRQDMVDLAKHCARLDALRAAN